jgi:hypothetical protein
MKKYLLALALGAATISNASANGFENWVARTEGYQVCLRHAETQGVEDWGKIRGAIGLCHHRYGGEFAPSAGVAHAATTEIKS